LATYYFVALFIPLLPICRYRVINAGNGSYRFLGKAPLRTFDRWHLGLVLAGFFTFVILANLDLSALWQGFSSSSPNSQV
jgi:hypothetical protein